MESAPVEPPPKWLPQVPSKPTALKIRSTSYAGLEATHQHETLRRKSTTSVKDKMAQLLPFNGNGCGILSERFDSSSPGPRYNMPLNPEIYNACEPTARHLVFVSSTARFHLGATLHRRETLWRKTGRKLVAHQALDIFETDILDTTGFTVGRLVLPDRWQRPYYPGPPQGLFDFLVIPEAQFFGDENQIVLEKFPLYNVMMVKWDDNRVVAERIALGNIGKHHWEAAKPKVRTVVLA